VRDNGPLYRSPTKHTMVQRLRLHAPPQERVFTVLQSKRTNTYENGRLEKELPALPRRRQAAIVDSAGLRDSQREPSVSAPRLQGRGRTAADRSRGTQGASPVTSANASGRKSAASEAKRLPYRKRRQAANGGGGAPRPARFDPDSSSISDDGGWSRTASTCSAASSAASITSVASVPEVAAKAHSRLGLKLRRAVVRSRDMQNFLKPLTVKIDSLREQIQSTYSKYDAAMKILHPSGKSGEDAIGASKLGACIEMPSPVQTSPQVGMRVRRHPAKAGISSPKIRGAPKVVSSVLVSSERFFNDSLATEIQPYKHSHVDDDENDDRTGMVTVQCATQGLRNDPDNSKEAFGGLSSGSDAFMSPKQRYLPGVGRCIIRKHTTNSCTALVCRHSAAGVTADADARVDSAGPESEEDLPIPDLHNVAGGESSDDYVLVTAVRHFQRASLEPFRRTASL